jgi:hypothetical protein
MRLLRIALLLWALVAVVSCHQDDRRSVRDLAAARVLWAENGPDSYALTQQRLCFCPPPWEWTVVVSGGAPAFIVSATDPGYGEDPWMLDEYALQSARSVEELFDWVEDLLRDADQVTVEFDPMYGYPTKVDADPILMAVDDEITFTCRDLVATGACTEIGCTSELTVTLRAAAGTLPTGLYDVRVRDARGNTNTRSLDLMVPVSSLALEFPLPDGAVTVDVDVNGAAFASFDGSPDTARLQPNGPLCPPVCYAATLEGAVP